MQTAEATFKICIFGDSGVGKTTLTQRYLTGSFRVEFKKTLGAEIFVKYLNVEKIRVVLQIWDFGGEDIFAALLPCYANGSSGGIFMYDITNKRSFEKVKIWLDTFKGGLIGEEKNIPILMVGSKKDQEENRINTLDEAIDVFKTYNFYEYIECSSKTGENIEKIFQIITRAMMKNVGLIPKT